MEISCNIFVLITSKFLNFKTSKLRRMRKILIFITTVLLYFSCSKEIEKYDLDWKISENDSLFYNIYFGTIDTLISVNNEEIFDTLNPELENTNFITILYSQSVDIIDIEMYSYIQNKGSITSKDNLLSNGEIMLRGKVYKKGKIASFYLHEHHKNLLAIMFQLPNEPVSVGDTWNIDVNMIHMDQSFVCDTFEKENLVKFIELENNNNEQIAVLKYNLHSRVFGQINSNMFLFGDPNVFIRANYTGTAKFNIDKGKWQFFEGFISVEAQGISHVNNQMQKIKLEEIAELPSDFQIITETEQQLLKQDTIQFENEEPCEGKYCVQIKASKESISIYASEFQELPFEVEEIYTPNEIYQYKYIVENECDEQTAKQIKLLLVDVGYTEAFVTTRKK